MVDTTYKKKYPVDSFFFDKRGFHFYPKLRKKEYKCVRADEDSSRFTAVIPIFKKNGHNSRHNRMKKVLNNKSEIYFSA